MENKTEQILKDIKHYENVNRNLPKTIEGLLAKEYTEIEIINGIKNYKFKNKNQNRIIGLILIIIGVIMFMYFIPTFVNNGFYYELSSMGDFFRLNERIIKYGLSLSLILTGVLIIFNKNFTNKLVKVSLLIISIIFTLFITTYHSYIAYITGILAVILLSQIILPGKTNNPKVLEILSNNFNIWKGSIIYIPILMCLALLWWTPIEFVFLDNGNGGSTANLKFLDYTLMYSKTIIIYLSLITAILLSINKYKFKILPYVLSSICLIFCIISLFHTNFQKALIPSLIICIVCIITILKNKLLLTKSKKH